MLPEIKNKKQKNNSGLALSLHLQMEGNSIQLALRVDGELLFGTYRRVSRTDYDASDCEIRGATRHVSALFTLHLPLIENSKFVPKLQIPHEGRKFDSKSFPSKGVWEWTGANTGITFGSASGSKTTSKWLLFQALCDQDGLSEPAGGTAFQAFSQLTESWHTEGVTTTCPQAHPLLARLWYHQLQQTVPIPEPGRFKVRFSSSSTLIFSSEGHQAPRSGLLMPSIWDPSFFFLVCLFVGLADQSIKRVDLLTDNPQTPINVMIKCWGIEQTCLVCFDRSSSG